MNMLNLRLLLPVFGFFTLSAVAQTEIFPLDQLKPGLKGTGKTVFSADEVETFGVEILGVLKNVGPKQNMILARLSGDEIDKYGVFSGMSGSPVYIDNRLVGAVASSFTFATDPIAGITPIQEMLDIFKRRPNTSFKIGRKMNPSQLYAVSQLPGFAGRIQDRELDLNAQFTQFSSYGQLRPIATPINFSGFAASALHDFVRHFRSLGWSPIMGGGTARQEDWNDLPLEPGSTISVQLVRGDMEMSASGTVTHIAGDKVYAFGHPFFSVGYTDIPFSKANVLGVIPSLMIGQKISASAEPVGAIRQDRATGILGYKGAKPKLIPVKLKLKTSRNKTIEFDYEVVNDSFLTPLLISLTVHSSIVSSERSMGGQTVQLKCKIALEGEPEVNFENNISDVASSPALAAITAAAPVYLILNSGFEDIVVKQISLELSAVEKTRDAVLNKVWQDKLEARAGEEVGITVFLRKANGEVAAEEYPVKIPEGISPGPLKIMVGDGVSVTKVDAEMEQSEFIPQTVKQLVKAINNLKKNDRLYIRLFREKRGAVIAGEGLPGLPPSLLELYNSKKTSGDTQPIKRVVYMEHELPATDYVLTGHKILEINIKG